MKRRILSTLLTVSLLFGCIKANAVFVSFEEYETQEQYESAEGDTAPLKATGINDEFSDSTNNISVSFEGMGKTDTSVTENDSNNEFSNSINDVSINFKELEKTGASITEANPNDGISLHSNEVWTFSYTRYVQEFEAPYTGKYYIEAKGASGGGAGSTIGGKGGITTGYINLKKGETIYLCIGQHGEISGAATYNGGGAAHNGTGSGGGATSITTANRGELKNFENHKDEIIAVAGGAGGNRAKTGDNDYYGHGGGISGAATNVEHLNGASHGAKPGTQTSGYKFGCGEDGGLVHYSGGCEGYSGAGGGGYYGGHTGNCGLVSGAGGSGYINPKIFYDANSTAADNLGNGSVVINYEGAVYSSLVIDLQGHGTYNGQTGMVTLDNAYGTTITVHNPSDETYKFYGWDVAYGTFNGSNYTYGFDDTYIKAIWISPLEISGTEDNENNQLTMNIDESDTFDKVYIIYQSTDGKNFYAAKQNSVIAGGFSGTKEYTATGSYQVFEVPADGLYKFTVYGSISYHILHDYPAFYIKGGKSEGYRYLKKGQKLYIACGNAYKSTKGGWNGGGNGGIGAKNMTYFIYKNYDFMDGTGGGGATHIATALRGDGQLKNYNNYRDEVLIVAGGAGGMSNNSTGAEGGGLKGNPGVSTGGTALGIAAQDSGYAFGQGQNGMNRQGNRTEASGQTGDTSNGVSGNGGGGGGWYGGYASQKTRGINTDSNGSGGSGYIGGVVNGSTITGASDTTGKAVIELSQEYLTGNGSINIHTPDIDKPNMPSNGKASSNNNKLVLSWTDNGDNGTTYFHKAESHIKDEGALDGLGEKLSESATIKNYIETGVKGYYYYIDTKPTGTAAASNTFTASAAVTIDKPSQKSYIHIAAVDHAGNISNTYSYEIPSVANYTVKYYKMDINGDYIIDKTVNGTTTIGTSVTPEVKVYEGFKTPESVTKTVLADGSTEISYYYERNKYEATYIDKTSGGKELGRSSKPAYYDADVRGSELGDDKSDNAYYPQYRYVSDTAAKVTTDGAIVYRIFESCETEAEANLQWNDNNNKDGFRPATYKLELKQNGTVIDEVELPSGTTNYVFPGLQKYDATGKPYQYTFNVEASDRYSINFDDNGNLIIEDYQPASFSVIIPKQITLDGNTGYAGYTVSVNGVFYYNDTLTVKPVASFILADRSNISSMQASVSQPKTAFTKEDNVTNGCSANGNIQVNRNYFSGNWTGYFNFYIHFEMEN